MGLNGTPLELRADDTWRADEPLTYEVGIILLCLRIFHLHELINMILITFVFQRVIKRVIKRFIFESQSDAPSNEGRPIIPYYKV